MKFSVVIFPSKEVQDKANEFRMRYDSNYVLIPPHITLRHSFEADEEKIKEIINYLHSIAKNISPFTLVTGKVKSFSPVNNVIYFSVEASKELSFLNEQMNKGILSSQAEYAFVPHITIGQGLPNAEFADVLGRLKMRNFHWTQVIDRFHLLYQLNNGSWTVHETFHLGS